MGKPTDKNSPDKKPADKKLPANLLGEIHGGKSLSKTEDTSKRSKSEIASKSDVISHGDLAKRLRDMVSSKVGDLPQNKIGEEESSEELWSDDESDKEDISRRASPAAAAAAAATPSTAIPRAAATSTSAATTSAGPTMDQEHKALLQRRLSGRRRDIAESDSDSDEDVKKGSALKKASRTPLASKSAPVPSSSSSAARPLPNVPVTTTKSAPVPPIRSESLKKIKTRPLPPPRPDEELEPDRPLPKTPVTSQPPVPPVRSVSAVGHKPAAAHTPPVPLVRSVTAVEHKPAAAHTPPVPPVRSVTAVEHKPAAAAPSHKPAAAASSGPTFSDTVLSQIDRIVDDGKKMEAKERFQTFPSKLHADILEQLNKDPEKAARFLAQDKKFVDDFMKAAIGAQKIKLNNLSKIALTGEGSKLRR